MIHQPQRILVSPLKFIGDTLLTVPVLRALRQAYPKAQIDLLLPTSVINLYELCPYVDRLVPRPKSPLSLWFFTQKANYDLVISMRRSITDPFVFKLAGVKAVIGFDEQRFFSPNRYPTWGLFLDYKLPFVKVDTTIPQVKTYLSLLRPLGITNKTLDERLELWANDSDSEHVSTLFEQYGINPLKPIVVFHAQSASRQKPLPPEKYIPALKYLGQQDVQIVTLGVNADRPFYDDLFQKADVPFFNLCGETSLRESYVAMAKATLLFSLDSAPIHMATAAGVPHIVGIYGPTNEHQWRPYPYNGKFTAVVNRELTCRPCLPRECEHNNCRMQLNPGTMVQALKDHKAAWELVHTV